MTIAHNTVKPWIRKIIVTLGPLEEYKGASSGDIVQLVSDGSQNSLKITCAINKTVMGMPSPSTISIYNLSKGTRNSIKRSLTKITVEAGWYNTEMHRVFQGSVVSAVHSRSGPDIVTKLTAIAGYGALTMSTASVTYAEGTPVSTAVKDLGAKLPGVSLGESKEVTGEFGKGGWSFAGGTKDALTELANQYGFSWNVDDGKLNTVGDKAKLSGVLVLDGKDGGLIMISPTLTGPMQIQTGVKIKALYVPGVSAGSTVRVRSTLDESLNGEYRIHTANIALDTFSENWTMDLESFKYGAF